LVDAFSYLVLGHVLVANMTGNVVFLGFALAGASGFSTTASLVALGSFGLAGDPSQADRTWVLLTEAPDGGWGLAGHAHTNAELVAAARAQIAELQAQSSNE
jgi:hypothetical protein